jgi:pepF/M3 family oligoendopeptidase
MARDLGPLPHWDVKNVYPSLESPEFGAALAELDRRLDEHEGALDRDGIGGKTPRLDLDDERLARALEGCIDRTNWLASRFGTLVPYAYAFYSTNTQDETAKRRVSELESRQVKLEAHGVRFQAWIRAMPGLAKRLDALAARSDKLRAHRFFLEEAIEQARHMMSEAEEVIASALAPAGASAWRKLQQAVSSQVEVPFEREGKTEMLPMSRIRALAADPDADVRRRAYEAELATWEKWKEPCAAALNGVKGWAGTLLPRRGYERAVDPSIEQARIDRATLDALLEAMRGSLPDFRRYYRAKARALGKERLAWWDIEAPVSKASRVWRYDAAEAFIVSNFRTFSDRLAEFARRAFAGRWIDAEPRAGKVGGGFCMGIDEAKESRILVNYDGAFDDVSTLAHELGHAYHNEVLRDVEPLRAQLPMTLAETASIFCETIAFDAAFAEAPAEERLGILEARLLGASQVVVDIYSRYLFETRLFERRAASELSAGELCELMKAAQVEAYGDALDPAALHPYMWAVKGHYYSADLGFYNYPYAFGLLFGLGLYAIYKSRGAAFCADYDGLLGATGLGKAADLAARFGIDIRTRAFWDGGIAQVRGLIDRYEALVK